MRDLFLASGDRVHVCDVTLDSEATGHENLRASVCDIGSVGDVERLFAAKHIAVLSNWAKAEASPIPIPPEGCEVEGERFRSAVRGWKGFNDAGCAGCHSNYGRDPQFKYDLWGTVVMPRNLTLGGYRGGLEAKARLLTLEGTLG